MIRKALTILLFASAAQAQPITQNAYWEGSYAGLTYGNATGTTSDFASKTVSGGGGAPGFVLGFHNAYGRGSFIYGGEFAYSTGGGDGAEPCRNAIISCQSDLSSLGSLSMHFGTVQGNTLVYANAGIGFGGFDLSATNTNNGATSSDSITALGATLGVGVDMDIRPSLRLRLQASQYLFTDQDVQFGTNPVETFGFGASEIKLGIISKF